MSGLEDMMNKQRAAEQQRAQARNQADSDARRLVRDFAQLMRRHGVVPRPYWTMSQTYGEKGVFKKARIKTSAWRYAGDCWLTDVSTDEDWFSNYFAVDVNGHPLVLTYHEPGKRPYRTYGLPEDVWDFDERAKSEFISGRGIWYHGPLVSQGRMISESEMAGAARKLIGG